MGLLSSLMKFIHRHTGGLENATTENYERLQIHRHTGGLETMQHRDDAVKQIHRHTGGLEKSI